MIEFCTEQFPSRTWLREDLPILAIDVARGQLRERNREQRLPERSLASGVSSSWLCLVMRFRNLALHGGIARILDGLRGPGAESIAGRRSKTRHVTVIG